MSADRLQASALADRLVFGSETTFDPQDALELLSMMPSTKWWRRLIDVLPGVRLKGQLPGLGAAGATPGHGNVKMEGDKINFDLDSRGKPCLRAGQWRIYRGDSLVPFVCIVTIEQVMATDEGDERTVYLNFFRGRPTRMLLAKAAEFRIGSFSFGVVAAREWKLPT